MLEILEVIIDFARFVGDVCCPSIRFTFIGGLSDVGVVSAELLIGDSDGICCCLTDNELGGARRLLGGGDGVIDRDSVKRV